MTDFYNSQEWKLLRQKVFYKYGLKCMKCGRTPFDNVLITGAHIKSRALFPKLALKFSNQQVLCQPCNSRQGIKTEDYRVSKIKVTFWLFIAVTIIGLAVSNPRITDKIIEWSPLITQDMCEASVSP